jgi:hypothetical protein
VTKSPQPANAAAFAEHANDSGQPLVGIAVANAPIANNDFAVG